MIFAKSLFMIFLRHVSSLKYECIVCFANVTWIVFNALTCDFKFYLQHIQSYMPSSKIQFNQIRIFAPKKISNEQLFSYWLSKIKKAQCLKITEKVASNIASEASYVYILSGQKFIKNAKNGQFWRVFENLKLAVKQCYQQSHF